MSTEVILAATRSHAKSQALHAFVEHILTERGFIVHPYQRDMLAMLEQHTPDTLHIQRPRHEGKQAMFDIMKGLKAKAKQKRLRKLTAEEQHAKRYPAFEFHPCLTAKHRAFWQPKPCSSPAYKRAWAAMNPAV